MRLAVTGSIATDHLMAFPGRFTDHLLPDRLDRISLSFLVDTLEVRRGGAAANIAFGLAGLGLTPLLVGAVGGDFAEYEVWLKDHGVDTGGVRVSADRGTARFLCVTDQDANQIAAFYTGAMAESRTIDLRDVVARCGTVDLVLVSPGDPEAMLRHTEQCRTLGLAFAADPSQQIARLDGTALRRLVDGARWLFTNEYEAALLLERTRWTRQAVLERVGAWITTCGARGVRIDRSGHPELTVPAVPAPRVADPTGAGDAFRAGFLWAVAQDLPQLSAAQLGCALAALALETVGPQTYRLGARRLHDGVKTAYGTQAAPLLAALARHPPPRPRQRSIR
ncbi:carbohydrate kinase family protein [Streptomyces fulvoviolaceus]|uniref:carbohydrate kinase family protein n=1 Tax=Streptomyces fulvoviolaceus TaxID=285535 RepID=UPI0005BDE7A6|nr:carbohydrate kinase family protein [Streptomyces fulvoviolaceus]MCT9084612.1 carbohydrate kinase family protein [Streptomyces fulvoviolaceus]